MSTRRGSQQPITLEDLNSLKENIQTAFESALKREIQEFKSIIESQALTIHELKLEIKQLNESMNIQTDINRKLIMEAEKREQKDRECNIIISGIPEKHGSDLNADIIKLLSTVDTTNSYEICTLPIRLGKPTTNKNRPVKISVKTRAQRNLLINKARDTLRNKGIYLNYDDSPFTQKEKTRLRQKLKSLKENNSDKQYRITKNILYENDSEIDKVDIVNQFFRL